MSYITLNSRLTLGTALNLHISYSRGRSAVVDCSARPLFTLDLLRSELRAGLIEEIRLKQRSGQPLQ